MTTTTPALTLDGLFGEGCDCSGSPLYTAIGDGYVRVQRHPTLPLRIFNYTEKTAYDGVWNSVTLACRGLIVDDEDRIVARPFPKFFNHGQEGAATIALDAPVHVLDKADGSLGVLYPTGGGEYAIATRGSFASEQAIHATEVWQTRYAHRFQPRPEQTVLFEIVYPSNRIVVDYGDQDDLLLLGAVETATGAVLDPSWVDGWPGPIVEAFTAATFADALALPVRPNAEGFVVRCLHTGAMQKIKYAEYVALHRIVTGLSARTVWEHMLSGAPLAELIAPLPDEFHPWVTQIAANITATVDAEHVRLINVHADAVGDTRFGWPDWEPGDRTARAAFARVATSAQYRDDSWALFALLDGRAIRPELLKRAKPEPYVTPAGRTFTEDNS